MLQALPTDSQLPQLLSELRKDYGFEQFGASPLHGSIKLFASFVARARRHQLNGLSTAFTHRSLPALSAWRQLSSKPFVFWRAQRRRTGLS
jgi:hypothetical protein